MNIKDEKHTISANEINKFCYCPYQWFYERKYGKKELSQMKKELMNELGYDDSRLSFLKNGSEYHSKVRFNRFGRMKKFIVILLIFALIVFIAYVMKMSETDFMSIFIFS